MPVQKIPPAKNTRYQRNKAVLTHKVSRHLDHTSSVHQLSEKFDKGPPLEGAAPSRRGGTMKGRRKRLFHQEKEKSVTGSNSFRIPQYSSSKKPHHKKSNKVRNFQVSKDKAHPDFLKEENELSSSGKERIIEESLFTYCGGKQAIEECFKRPKNRKGAARCFSRKQGKA
ncbi:hypothetical protein O181_011899 [Austropuccinia psidii MF-1]|uniref:Uncharacterized protein n=1 Tax=Austropuccinia psidii MF-1 TaxID=1389203 RepID=A0A9Q3BTN0_9BASI|nr:hypothetical protein [Austropuccinia psidii MF-1]